MSWLLLLLAGLFEVFWAVGLKYSDGFRRPGVSALVVVTMCFSVVLLSMAMRTIPLGTAYAVWVGIGALGAAVCGVVFFQEGVSPTRGLFLALLVVSLVGLKLTTTEASPEVLP
jgi:quaternary ammonium compound-resistance protein SugE